MFAYCNNNPANGTDPTGHYNQTSQEERELLVMMLFGAAAVVAVSSDPQTISDIVEEVGNTLTSAKEEIYEYAQAVKQEAIEFIKKTPHVHHIVPVGEFSTRNAETKKQVKEMHEVLVRAHINRFIDPINLMIVSAETHVTLHTDVYISHVHSYIMATDGSKDQIYEALFALRIEIAAWDTLASGY